MVFANALTTLQVAIGSIEHILPVLFAVIFTICLIIFANKKLNKEQQITVFKSLGVFVSLTVLIYHLYAYFKGGYSIVTDLPLYLCSFMALFVFTFTHSRKYWLYEILLFWIIAGTSQAVITPDISKGFLSFEYLRYWIAHLGLLVIIFYATFVLNMRPKFKSVFKSFFALQLYMLIIFGINYVLGGNYSYLNEKPKSASLLDYLGDWPMYLLVVELMILPYFLIIYLPFYIAKKFKKQTT
ncbi:YwaF family protein [Lacinutrix venerupis]|uniref:YwaF family protein n=1 Tax=Lacinutrix venerupis TaxID=1486034 RepID=UPI0009FB7475|nr:TIGR02206 family membrane protein [Lacinutrix venerupis]